MKKMRGLFPSIGFIQNDCAEFDDLVLCGSRGWVCPGDPNYTENTDRKIYERELLRLEMSLSSGSKTGKRIIAATHFPPKPSADLDSGFMQLYKKYGVKTAVYGHLHGRQNFKLAFEGEYKGVDFRLISCDRVGFMPVLIR